MAGTHFALDPNFKALLRDLGISPAQVLRRAGLPGDLLSRGPVELPVEDYYAFWNALEIEGGNRSLTIEIGRAISVEMFSPPIFAALCSPNLEIAAQRLADYKPLIGPVRVDLDSSPLHLTIAYRWPTPATPPVLLATTELVFWIALARIATREHIRAAGITSPRWPTDRRALAEFCGSTLKRADQHSITFSRADAVRPFLTENDQMWRFFAPQLRKRLDDLKDTATITDRVRAALHETLPAGGSTVTAVTAHLATSPRTLQRQLNLEGTSFTQVLATTREQLARHYLSRGNMRTTDIAYLLGYDDTNSFYRAFRSWTGTTPDTLRTTASSRRR